MLNLVVHIVTIGNEGLIFCIDRGKRIVWESFTFLRGLHVDRVLASRALLAHSYITWHAAC